MKKVGFKEVYKKYKGKWVAFDDKLKSVVSSGMKADLVYQEAVKEGTKKPTLFKVPQVIRPYFGFIR